MLSANVRVKIPRSNGMIERLITARPLSASTIMADPVRLTRSELSARLLTCFSENRQSTIRLRLDMDIHEQAYNMIL